MTDQPSTQEPRDKVFDQARVLAGLSPKPTTQEAEKALRIIAEALSNADGAFHHPGSYGTRCVHEAKAALRSLRTQHTEQRAEIAQLNDRIDALQLQHTIDVDEIRALRRGRDGEGSPRNRAVR